MHRVVLLGAVVLLASGGSIRYQRAAAWSAVADGYRRGIRLLPAGDPDRGQMLERLIAARVTHDREREPPDPPDRPGPGDRLAPR